jgi:predicted nuclease with TOPRIM domain
LKETVKELREEIKNKEQKWKLSSDRLQKRIEELMKENSESKENILVLERERVSAWERLRKQALAEVGA